MMSRDKVVPPTNRDKWDKWDKNPLSHPAEPLSARPGQEVGQVGQKGRGYKPPSHLSHPSCPTPVLPRPTVVRQIDFVEPPPIGTVLAWRGQRYELAAWQPHQRRDGSPTVLLRWASHCAECAQPFEHTTPLRTGGPCRRCSGCAAPGRPVGGRRVGRISSQ